MSEIDAAFSRGYAKGRNDSLADAKARIEGHRLNMPSGSKRGQEQRDAFNSGLDTALAALTQPQTEKCPNPDCEGGTRPNGEGGWDMCPDCLEAANADGGGAATAAGAFDPDPLANPDCQECGNDDAGCLACGADANWDS